MASATHQSTSPYWSSKRKDTDNPFEKYAARRSQGASYTNRTRSRSRLLKYLLVFCGVVGLYILWSGVGWGAPRPPLEGKLRGSEPRDRSQIGKEKASLVMLVRCVKLEGTMNWVIDRADLRVVTASCRMRSRP